MDYDLVRNAKKGDNKSFSKLIKKYKSKAYNIAYYYLKNKEDSMDAVANAVEKAYRNIRKLRTDKFFETWFIRIVVNESVSIIRKNAKIIYYGDNSYIKNDNNIINDEYFDLKSQIEKLPDNIKDIIYLKFFMGYTTKEIAKIKGIPQGTVKTKLYKTLKKIKVNLIEGDNINYV